ncbi:MAG: ClpXP protease specificity-enhancing factor [Zoogloea sp.]|nr:ClpXP protease specificity-enhancing factor [Zoogloea sp.]
MSADTTKPYLLRAIYEWCSDHGFTPHIAVVVDSHTVVPRNFVRDGQIVLNIGDEATHQLDLGNDYIQFQARFGGVAQHISIPIGRVAAVYARENGQGMAFEVEETQDGEFDAEVDAETEAAVASEPPEDAPEPNPPRNAGRARLKIVK